MGTRYLAVSKSLLARHFSESSTANPAHRPHHPYLHRRGPCPCRKRRYHSRSYHHHPRHRHRHHHHRHHDHHHHNHQDHHHRCLTSSAQTVLSLGVRDQPLQRPGQNKTRQTTSTHPKRVTTRMKPVTIPSHKTDKLLHAR
eukprot:1110109-Rhodomonas_salina.7